MAEHLEPHRQSSVLSNDVADLLTIEEAAALLRIGRRKAYELAARFEATGGREGLPVVRLGRCLRVVRVRLEQFLLTDPPAPASLIPSPLPLISLHAHHLSLPAAAPSSTPGSPPTRSRPRGLNSARGRVSF